MSWHRHIRFWELPQKGRRKKAYQHINGRGRKLINRVREGCIVKKNKEPFSYVDDFRL